MYSLVANGFISTDLEQETQQCVGFRFASLLADTHSTHLFDALNRTRAEEANIWRQPVEYTQLLS